MGKDLANSCDRDSDLESPVQQAVFEYMEELQVSALEAMWFVEGDGLSDEA